MSDYRELLLGCGHARDKRMMSPGRMVEGWSNLITLDKNSACNPSVVCDLENPWRTHFTFDWDIPDSDAMVADDMVAFIGAVDQYIFRESIFDEVHAYEVLEHLGSQGDALAFFTHFSEIWRILKPDGFLCATVPSRYSPWLWGDPSHRRLINEESLSFLDQDNYRQLDGPRPTPMSDFRSIYRADFKVIERQDNHKQFFFILQAVKPSRVRERIP